MLREKIGHHSHEILLGVALIVVTIGVDLLRPQFLSPANLQSLLINGSVLAMVSAGMTLVILLAGIDISVGAVMGLVSLFIGWGLLGHWPLLLIALVAVLSGAMFGAINGGIIYLGHVSPIVATLGTMSIWEAAIFALLHGEWLSGLPAKFGPLVVGGVAGVPNIAWIILVIYGAMSVVLTKTDFGRRLYAIGNNGEAARLMGIPIKRTGFWAYVVVGVIVGLAAIVYTTINGNVENQVGANLPLTAIAAVVLGGVDILGGAGSIWGVLMGVAFIVVLENATVLLGIPALYDQAVVGAIILVAVLTNSVRRGRQNYRSMP